METLIKGYRYIFVEVATDVQECSNVLKRKCDDKDVKKEKCNTIKP